jgi:hypothetical protein
VARLSGSTAEFLHMWLIMHMGPRPFRLNAGGHLTLQFEPVLPADFFNAKPAAFNYYSASAKKWQTLALPANSYAFNMMGQALVVYHNPQRLHTFGPNKAVVTSMALRYAGRPKAIEIKSRYLDDVYAKDVRANKVERIDIQLG